MIDKESFISLTQTLDSLRDLALAEFALIELDNAKDATKSTKETKEFAEFVLKAVQGLRGDIAVKHQQEWIRLNPSRAKDFAAHIAGLEKSVSASCPPGFHEVGGVCVRV
ncbi:MAG: hypothetical protein ABI878_02025 [Acidobacteriota bacterium]